MLKTEWIEQIETPCIVIDVDKAKANIQAMQQIADQYGVALRPHVKTHKMPLFAQMQLKAGACGITCAKVSEAEVFAQAGINDIFIAYPMVGLFRIQRAIRLAAKIKRLILAVDSIECAERLNAAAIKADIVIEVRLEVDTGAKRTGIPREKAAELARLITGCPGLSLTGIYTFKGLVYQNGPTEDNELAGAEEGELMAAVAAAIREMSIPIAEISAGSTPTGPAVAKTGQVTEIRPGTYIFKDHMLCMEQAATPEQIAARIYATVVSTPCPEYAVIDGGTKTFPMDILLNAPPCFYPGYAIVQDNPDLELVRMNEEHGILTSQCGHTGLQVGQVLELIPIHICTAINLQNHVYLLEQDSITRHSVEARGMLV